MTLLALLAAGGLAATAFAAAAPAYKRPQGHDCGRSPRQSPLSVSGVPTRGPLPRGVPKGSVPQLDAFVLKGAVSCATAKSTVATFEANFNKPPTGYACRVATPYETVCSNGAVSIGAGIVYLKPSK